jgi:starch-binding outer membrane protein, SusD/RagB family
MKKIKYIALLLSGIFITNSCNNNDLNLKSPNDLSPETFFKTEAQVQAAVNAAYANLQTMGLYKRHIFFALDNMSQENSGNPQLEGNKKPFLNFSFDASSDIIDSFWDDCYQGIAKSNFVTDKAAIINALPDNILSQEKKNKFIAEARFMRAYYYFLLVNRFGDIPLFDKVSNSENGTPKSPKADIYKLIVADFDFASKNLLDKSVEEKGRATKGAAFAYLGKAFLYQKKYTEALAAFNSISGYSLEPNFYSNFTEENEHGIESLFEVEFSPSFTTDGTRWSGLIDGTGLSEATFRAQEYSVQDWFNVYPSDNLLDEYEPGDKRIGDTFYKVGDKYNNGNSTIDNISFARRAGWKKYSNYYKSAKEIMDSGINFKVMRYSDVLLMKAECENELGNQANAIAIINQVRTRSGLAGTTAVTKLQVFDALVHERKVELAGEQVRFDDILRWGIADKEINIKLNQSVFKVGKNELWPIPNREVATNPSINK